MEPLVCILVPFLEWNPLVEECVTGCLSLKYGNFRLCLLPNESRTVPDYIVAAPCVAVIATRLPGIAHKRNLGIVAHPAADYYACIDSDAVPAPDWLRNGVAAFGTSRDIGIVGGPDISPAYPGIMKRAVRNALASWLVGGERVFMKRPSPGRFTDDLRTCNFIVRREVFSDTILFDEAMPVGEDSALCLQASRRGWKLWFDDKVVVKHHNRALFLPFLRQRITAGYGVPFLLRKYPDLPLHGWLLRIAPLAAVFYLALGWTSCLVGPALFSAWAAGLICYLTAVGAEAIRHSDRLADAPLTAAAVLIGNLGPGLGILMAAAGMRLEIASFYGNREKGRS